MKTLTTLLIILSLTTIACGRPVEDIEIKIAPSVEINSVEVVKTPRLVIIDDTDVDNKLYRDTVLNCDCRIFKGQNLCIPDVTSIVDYVYDGPNCELKNPAGRKKERIIIDKSEGNCAFDGLSLTPLKFKTVESGFYAANILCSMKVSKISEVTELKLSDLAKEGDIND